MTLPTTVCIADCEECKGAGNVPHTQAGQPHQCFRCDGNGAVKRNSYGSGYKTRKTADAAIARGTGRVCDECKGTGTCLWPDAEHCYSCHDGKVVTVALPGMSWEGVPKALRYEMARGEAMEAYANAVTYVVKVANRGSTWNEMHLGMGSVVGITDYGRRWGEFVKAAKEDRLMEERDKLIAEVRERRMDGTQWVKLITPDGILTGQIDIILHRGGYTAMAADVPVSLAGLPPTYTDELLNREAW